MAALTPVNPMLAHMDSKVTVQAVGGDFFCVNTNTKQAAADPDDPYDIALGNDAQAANHKLILNAENAKFIDLFHFFTGTAPTTALVVACFGRKRTRLPNPLYPANIDATNWDKPDNATIGGGYWVPLFDRASGDHLLTFENTPQVVKDSTTGSSKAFKIVGGKTVNSEGYDELLFVVQTASDPSGVGQLLARFATE